MGARKSGLMTWDELLGRIVKMTRDERMSPILTAMIISIAFCAEPACCWATVRPL
jgi:hypothetical protein